MHQYIKLSIKYTVYYQIILQVQIRPWSLSDSDCVKDGAPLDPRKTVFVGGIPRPLKASELAEIMNSKFGNVCHAGIDTDPLLKYPKGAGRVTFYSQSSYISAVSARFVQLAYNDADKKVINAKPLNEIFFCFVIVES